ncbi:MAG: dUTP diphosphatase [Deltaproteobacteria bacterium]|nr:dUTP diphosphatase [Deltaproteobacteria bacterium]
MSEEHPVVKFKRIRESDRDIPPPGYMTEGAAGMDIYSATAADVTIQPLGRALIPSGYAVSIPPGFEGEVRPRSGLALKHGVTVLNSPGTIDSDYRGELCVILVNLGDKPFVVKRGDRVAQLIISRAYRCRAEVVDSLDVTERNDGGFGHTDRK